MTAVSWVKRYTQRVFSCLLACMTLLPLPAAIAASLPLPLMVRIPAQDEATRGNHDYYLTLLRAALERGAPGPVILTEVPVVGTQDRLLRYLETDELIDVYWVGTTTAREQTLAPVRVPLTAGLLGLRVPVILSERQEEFSQINTLDHLRQYTACQGDQWPDSDILEANGLPVLRIAKYHQMYKMLQARRCDYFPRSLNEVYAEVASQPDQSFLIEERIILSYRYPLYFFTSKQNTMLNDRLSAGLHAMAQDGSLLVLMQQHPTTAAAFPLSRFRQSRIFALANPLLPAETPVTDPRLWLAFPGTDPAPGTALPPRTPGPLTQ